MSVRTPGSVDFLLLLVACLTIAVEVPATVKRVTDGDTAILLVERLKAAHPKLERVSFDRGFHSPENARRIAELLPDACLPNSGEKALAEQAAAASASWTWHRGRHRIAAGQP